MVTYGYMTDDVSRPHKIKLFNPWRHLENTINSKQITTDSLLWDCDSLVSC